MDLMPTPVGRWEVEAKHWEVAAASGPVLYNLAFSHWQSEEYK